MVADKWRRSFVISFLVALAAISGCAITVSIILAHIGSSYVPFDRSGFAPLVFIHYRLPAAKVDLRGIAPALLIWAVAFFAILSVLRRRSNDRRVLAAILASQAALLVIALASPVPLDSDQYAYVGFGAAVESHANPYHPALLPSNASSVRERVASHWGDPLVPDAYGPLFTLGDGLVLWPFRTMSLGLQAHVLRLLAALAALVSSLLIAGTVRDARWRAVSVAAFALNPLVILETANGAHNDIFMVACVLGSAYLLSRNAFARSGFLLGCAIAIKFAYAPLIVPFAAYTYLRTRKAIGVLGAIVCVAAPIVLSAAPFGLRNSIVAPLATRRVDVLDHLPLFDRLGPHVSFGLLAAAIAACALLASVQILRDRLAASSAPLIALLLLTWLFADKIEPWYAIVLTPVLLLAGYGGVATFAGVSTAALIMLSGSFLDVYPTTLALAVAVLLVLGLRYAVADRSGTSLMTTLRPSSLPS
ncbi:MAG TPA: hypothetical protein VMD07_09705 [Candidatus Acidoferrales bacterium]|nr:hypothetical protein [Candidatus Acidoferrales bacterium]